MDLVWTVIFVAECSLKVIALGFVCNGKTSYLRDYWNILDFGVVVVSLLLLLGLPQVISSEK